MLIILTCSNTTYCFLMFLERAQFAENNAESCGTVPPELAVRNQNNANSEAQPYYEYVKLWHHKCCGISRWYWLRQKSMFIYKLLRRQFLLFSVFELLAAVHQIERRHRKRHRFESRSTRDFLSGTFTAYRMRSLFYSVY